MSESYFAGPLGITIEEITGPRSYSQQANGLVKKRQKRREVCFVTDIKTANVITLDEYNPLYVTTRGAISRLG